MVNNGIRGSCFDDYAWHLAKHLQVRALRVTDAPRRVCRANGVKLVMTYEARIVELFENDFSPAHAVCAMQDGDRWTFHRSGPAMPVESSFELGARNARHRFTRENLRALLAAHGAPILTPEPLGTAGAYYLLREDVEPGRSLAARDLHRPAHHFLVYGLQLAAHLHQHPQFAARVIACLERTAALDPQVVGEVEPHLVAARQLIGKD